MKKATSSIVKASLAAALTLSTAMTSLARADAMADLEAAAKAEGQLTVIAPSA